MMMMIVYFYFLTRLVLLFLFYFHSKMLKAVMLCSAQYLDDKYSILCLENIGIIFASDNT